MQLEMELSPPNSPTPHGNGMACLELEMDTSDGYDDEDTAPLRKPSMPRRIGGIGRNGSSHSIPPPTEPTTMIIDLAHNVREYVKLAMQLYPKATMIAGSVVGLLLLVATTRSLVHAHHKTVTRNHGELTPLETASGEVSTEGLDETFIKLASEIHHWCLFGGNDNCDQCDNDPTAGMGQSKSESPVWTHTHKRNKQLLLKEWGAATPLDVLFLGDETFQAWGEGQFLDKSFDEGPTIVKSFEDTFQGLRAASLGIYSDKTSNLLWRIQHGEIAAAKIYWILVGANDLALAMCSEDVVLLGILRVAEEIAHLYPGAQIVIQGLLPRSNHHDGSLHLTDEARGSTFRTTHNNNIKQQVDSTNNMDPNNIWTYRTAQIKEENLDIGHSTTSSALQQAHESLKSKQPQFDYYIWPSILAINAELQGFCEQQSNKGIHGSDGDAGNGGEVHGTEIHHHRDNQFVYFDADALFVEDAPNGKDKVIIRDLMPNSIFLSAKGHQVLMNAVKAKLDELLAQGKT